MADGRTAAAGRTPATIPLDPRKRYEVTFKKEGFAPVTRPLVIGADGTAVVDVGLKARPRSVRSDDDAATAALVAASTAEPAGEASDAAAPAPDEAPATAPVSSAAAAITGTLSLGAKPPCRVFVDGRDSGEKTPLVGFRLAAGKHRITLVNNEFGLRESFDVVITPDRPTRVLKDLTSRLQPAATGMPAPATP
jgi:hypothetical protein